MSVVIGWVLGHLKLAAYAVGALALAIAVAFIRQSGADAEKAKQAAKDLKAASTIGQKRAEARAASDTELDQKIDKWSHK